MIKTSHNHTVPAFRACLPLCAAICFLLLPTGCQRWSVFNQSVRRSEPALSMTVDRDTLVETLNQHSAGLNGWQCHSTSMRVKMPRVPAATLTGSIACKSPNYFRLKADNFMAEADLGSNASKCWAYVKPSPRDALVTWNHEDTSLIQQFPSNVPYIDPNWLMLVLGITPLDASEYQLGPAPNGRPELWLTAVEQSPQGRMMKRIVKVDANEGVIREHALYDDHNNVIVRAVLTSHRPHAGYLVPQRVQLLFPPTKTQLMLTFKNITTNPVMSDQLWHMPNKKTQVVDVGLIARQRLVAAGHRLPVATRQASHHPNADQPNADQPEQIIVQQSYETRTALNQPTREQASFEEFMAAEEAKEAAKNIAVANESFFDANVENTGHAQRPTRSNSALQNSAFPGMHESEPTSGPEWDNGPSAEPNWDETANSEPNWDETANSEPNWDEAPSDRRGFRY